MVGHRLGLGGDGVGRVVHCEGGGRDEGAGRQGGVAVREAEGLAGQAGGFAAGEGEIHPAHARADLPQRRAGVHADGAADRAGDAGQRAQTAEPEPGEALE
ncbi:MAG: hypothetical protein ACK559_39390, partial [bacterium]